MACSPVAKSGDVWVVGEVVAGDVRWGGVVGVGGWGRGGSGRALGSECLCGYV
jgi:hypothetical protein